MSTIDRRIVEMVFENSQFEKAINTTMGSLDSLKKKLMFEGIKSGISEVNDSIKSIDLSSIADGIETISSKFTAFDVVAISAINRITNKVIDAGEQIARSLTLEPLSTGFQSYEEKLNAVKTIMAATGEDIDSVNKKLEKLIWFTDETSYNFSDMVTNMGTFTSAGVEINTALAAMEGIALIASKAGKGTNEAAHVMYNFAQALGQGYVSLMDWKSVQTMSMDTEEFKNVLIETGLELGTLTKKGEEFVTLDKGLNVTTASFSQTLSEKWLTTDVLLKSLEKYSSFTDKVYEEVQRSGELTSEVIKNLSDGTDKIGETALRMAQETNTFKQTLESLKMAKKSQWAKSYEYIIGDKDEATALWTKVNNDLWDYVLEYDYLRNEVIKGWKELGGRDLLLSTLDNTLQSSMSVMGKFRETLYGMFPEITSERLYILTANLDIMSSKLREITTNEDNLNRFGTVLEKVFSAIMAVPKEIVGIVKELFDGIDYGSFVRIIEGAAAALDIWRLVITGIIKAIGQLVLSFKDDFGSILEIIAKFADFLVEVDNQLQESDLIYKSFSKISSAASAAGKSVSDFGKELIESGKQAIKARTGYSSFEGIIGAFSNTFKKLFEFLEKVSERLGKILKNILSFTHDIAYSIASGFKEADFNIIGDLINTGMLSFLVLTLNNISNSASDAVDLVKKLKDDILSLPSRTSQSVIDFVGALKEKLVDAQETINAMNIMQIAAAILALALSITVLSAIPSQKLSMALGALSLAIIEISSATVLMQVALAKLSINRVVKVSGQLIALSVAVLILASALGKLSGYDWNTLKDGLKAMAGSLVLMGSSLVIIQYALQDKTIAKIGGLLLSFSASILVLAKALKVLSEIDQNSLAASINSMVTIFGLLSLLVLSSGFAKSGITTGFGIMEMATAVIILVEALNLLSSLDLQQTTLNVILLGGLLAELGVYAGIVRGGMFSGLGLIEMATAIIIFSKGLGELNKLDHEETAESIKMVGKVLNTFGFAMLFLGGKRSIVAGVAIAVLAADMLLLAAALNKLGSISPFEVLNAIISFVQVTIPLTLLSAALSLLAPAVITFSVALSALGVSLILVGTGLLAVSAGTTATIGVLFGTIKSILNLLPTLITIAGESLKSFFVSIKDLFPVLLDTLSVVLSSIIDLIGSFVTFLIPVIGDIFTVVKEFLLAKIDSVKASIEEIKEKGVMASLSDFAKPLVSKIGELILYVIKAIWNRVTDFYDAACELINAINKGINDSIDSVISFVYKLIVSALEAIRKKFAEWKAIGEDLIGKLISGIAAMALSLQNKAVGIVNDAKSAINDTVGGWVRTGIDLIQGLIDGIGSMAHALWDKVSSVIGNAIDSAKETLDEHSPSRVFFGIGAYATEGFILGIGSMDGKVSDASDSMASNAISSIQNAIKTISDYVDDGIDSNPVITPVIDLSNINDGINSMNERFNSTIFSLNGTVNLASDALISSSKKNDTSESKDSVNQNGSNTFNFTQNNYSPKALSRIEIYRQTNNQFSSFKGAIST